MKILLIALNAKFIHSSMALRSLKKYSEELKEYIFLSEYTINHEENFILSDIYKQKPDVLCFSCYIWNIGMIMRIIKNIKKVMPNVIIILGGPEVSYDAIAILEKNEEIEIIIRGEGEKTFKEVALSLLNKNTELGSIDGITYKKENGIYSNQDRSPMNLNEIPFIYDEITDLKNKIIYYETQRGCPYHCQYCLSSIEKGVRFLSKERVATDLNYFLNQKVRQVKLVDRTFNCNKNHALFIWKHLIDNDNGITNFHMEITADLIDEECIQLLKKARPGLFQFEIGVQSTNVNTIAAIQRNTHFEKLAEVVKEIKKGRNIHQHLDLIVGLPEENYDSFKKSFNDVYELKPEQFQMGFLKLLKGSGLKNSASKYGIVCSEQAPYEVLYTRDISYDEILRLKIIEEMVEIYYNSGKAIHTMGYLVKLFDTPFDCYEKLSHYWERNGYHRLQHNKMELFTILFEFCNRYLLLSNNIHIIKQLIKFDIYSGDNVKSLPDWIVGEQSNQMKERKRNFFNNEKNRTLYFHQLSEFDSKQVARMCHIEIFDYNILDLIENDSKIINNEETAVLFHYYTKNAMTNGATYYKIKL